MSIESDTQSIEAVVTALYQAISRSPGELPDWERMRPLFIEGARIIPPSREGGPLVVMTLGQFVQRVSEAVETAGGDDRGFHEREAANRTETFGNIAHVWSTYESRYGPADPEPFSRGINSFQLVRHSERWWVVTIFWDAESDGQRIPARYLR